MLNSQKLSFRLSANKRYQKVSTIARLQASVKQDSAYVFYMTTIVYTIQSLLYIHTIGLIFAVKNNIDIQFETCIRIYMCTISTQTKCIGVMRPRTSQYQCRIGLHKQHGLRNGKKNWLLPKFQRCCRAWSRCYLPGVNDLDGKFNINPVICGSFPQKGNTLRRMWSYFYTQIYVHRKVFYYIIIVLALPWKYILLEKKTH